MNRTGPACLMTINVPPPLEDTIVDWLLSRDLDRGFTSYRADGHGSDHGRLSVEEQVRGRERRIEFRLVLDETAVDGIVAALEADFPGADVFYFAVPVLRFGHARERNDESSGAA